MGPMLAPWTLISGHFPWRRRVWWAMIWVYISWYNEVRAFLEHWYIDVPHLFQYSDTNILTKQFINDTIFFYHYRRISISIWQSLEYFMTDYDDFFSLYWYMMTSQILIFKSSISSHRAVMLYTCKYPCFNGFIFHFRCTSSMVVIPQGIVVRRWADNRKFNPYCTF